MRPGNTGWKLGVNVDGGISKEIEEFVFSFIKCIIRIEEHHEVRLL
jgi:hypothetical protein